MARAARTAGSAAREELLRRQRARLVIEHGFIERRLVGHRVLLVIVHRASRLGIERSWSSSAAHRAARRKSAAEVALVVVAPTERVAHRLTPESEDFGFDRFTSGILGILRRRAPGRKTLQTVQTSESQPSYQ